MKRLLMIAAIVLMFPLQVLAVCTTTLDGTWSGVSGGTAHWSCGTPTAADLFVIPDGFTVTIDGDLGRIDGSITVQNGGVLEVDQTKVPLTIDASGGIVYESGSCPSDSCNIGGKTLAKAYVPDSIAYSGSTVTFDLSEDKNANVGLLPWTLCDVPTCASGDIQVGTYLHFSWQQYPQTDLGIIDPVDPMGMILRVSAVDATAETITVEFPTVSTKAQGSNYIATETLDAVNNRQSNFITVPDWTVASVGTATNNEGKVRYETIINSADTPFARDGDWSGFLACKAGTDRCARIIYTETDYTSTSEMFTTLKDPSLLWAAGDELDIYYAKFSPGQEFTPFNGPTYTSTTPDTTIQGTVRIEEGSGIATIKNAAFILGWNRDNTASGGATLTYGAGTDTGVHTLQRLYFNQCDSEDSRGGGDQITPVCLHLANRDTVSNVPDGDALHNVHLSDIFIAYPNAVDNWGTNPDVDAFLSFGIQISDEADQRIGNQSAWIAGTVSEWKNVTLRRIRIEGVTTGITNASGGRDTGCDDGLVYQDILTLHSRSSKPRDNNHIGEDQIEHFMQTSSCGSDRLISFAPNNGTAIGPLRWARPNNNEGWGGTVYATNMGVFGGPGQQGNTTDAAGRDIVNNQWPTMIPGVVGGVSPYNLRGGQDHTHGLPWSDGNGYFVSNFLTDFATNAQFSYSYGALVGWFRQRTPAFNALACGTVVVGTFRHGGASSGAIPNNKLPCAAPHTSIKVIDNYWVNSGSWSNNGSEATCDAFGANPGTDKYQCDGPAEVNNFLFNSYGTKSISPEPSYLFDGNLITMSSTQTATGKQLMLFGLPALGSSMDVTVKNTAFINTGSKTARLFWMQDETLIPDNLQIGPNVWTDGASAKFCYIGGTVIGGASTTCDFTSPWGYPDFSPDDSPNGANNLYIGGNIATGENVRILGSDGGTGDATLAQPQYAGPVVWDVFAWVTPEMKSARFVRTSPRSEYLPPIVRARVSPAVSSGGCGSFGGAFLCE